MISIKIREVTAEEGGRSGTGRGSFRPCFS